MHTFQTIRIISKSDQRSILYGVTIFHCMILFLIATIFGYQVKSFILQATDKFESS